MKSDLNHYEILECNPSATYEELKKSYQRLVKQNHPDKLPTNLYERTSEVEHIPSAKFLLINQAWKVLRDCHQRKLYDASQLQSEIQQDSIIYAEITTNSLIFQDSIAYFLCRCGEQIEIHADDFMGTVTEEKVQFECSECSNNILVTVD